MTNKDLVSVITPVFNGKNYLLRALNSLQSQTHENWECLLVSDDGVDYQSWLKSQGFKDSRVRFYNSPNKRSGPNIARNVGKKHAIGEWVAPLDADDLYYPERLTRLIKAATETGLALDNIKVVNEHTNQTVSHGITLPNKHLSITDFFDVNIPLLMFFHRDMADHEWEDLPRGGDTIFNLRALEKANKVVFLEEALHEYRVHNKSMCHAEKVGDVFDQAYEMTLERLNKDGLGFQTNFYRENVAKLIRYKKDLNIKFEQALQQGFKGDFQLFLHTVEPEI